MGLTKKLRSEIVNFLQNEFSSFLPDSETRRAFVNQMNPDQRFQSGIQFDKSSSVFIANLVNYCEGYGNFDDGRYPLIAALETIKQKYVGSDKGEKCAYFISKIRDERTPLTESEGNTDTGDTATEDRKKRKFLLILTSLILGIMFGVGIVVFTYKFFPEAFSMLRILLNMGEAEVSLECSIVDANEIFKDILFQDSELAHLLKKSINPPTCVNASYEPFEDGLMIWRSDSLEIFTLLSSDSSWQSFRDVWYEEGMSPRSCEIEIPEGMFQPKWGFGSVWCEHEKIRDAVGFAITPEQNKDLVFQTFRRGWLILVSDDVYALVYSKNGYSGTWKKFSASTYKTLSLKPYSEIFESENSKPEDNLGITGMVHLPDDSVKEKTPFLDILSGSPTKSIPFETGWKVSTQCSHLPERPASIRIDVNVSKPLSLHLLLQAGWGLMEYDNLEIGKIRLNFSNGSKIETPLILGNNIRDWAKRPGIAVTTISSSNTIAAREGVGADGETPGGMDIVSISIPEQYSSLQLANIEIFDNSLSVTQELNPCIHLIAITVRHLR